MTYQNNNPQQNNQDRQDARAPYNFVPLPERAIRADEQPGMQGIDDVLPSHNVFRDDRLHGYFDVMLTTESPLYIRGPLTRKEAEDKEAHRNKPDFFHTGDPNSPAIPGSSLRGMLRSLLEIITWSKLTRVSQRQLFYRTVDDSVLGKEYSSRMTGNVETGFMQRSGSEYSISKCVMLRVERSKLDNLYEGTGPNKTPRWSGKWHQYMNVWIKTSDDVTVDEILPTDPNRSGWEPGILVITGDMMKKKSEFVFLLPTSTAEQIPVDSKLVSRFHDDDQITQWQEKAFPVDSPRRGNRERKGLLALKNAGAYENPVFFLRENKSLIFFGRAGMFRIPYHNSPYSLIPDTLRDPSIADISEAMFGYVRTEKQGVGKQGDKQRAYSSRVIVTDASLITKQIDPYESDITPPTLGTPKPTAFQHYLIQPNTNDPKRFQHYDSASSRIRGHKLYWRQTRARGSDIPNSTTESLSQNDTQHTRIRPIKKGLQFQFRVSFENLTRIELGSLAWILTLGSETHHPDARHMLGMGKSFGMGVVKLDTRLVLEKRVQRYTSLFADTGWSTGYDDGSSADYIGDFEQFMVDKIGDRYHLRLSELLAMLQLRDNRDLNNDLFSHMSLQDFKKRSILRSPLSIAQDYDTALKQKKEKERLEKIEADKALRRELGIQIGDEIRGEVFEVSDGIWFTPDSSIAGDREYQAQIPSQAVLKRRREGERVKARVIEIIGNNPITLICEQII